MSEYDRFVHRIDAGPCAGRWCVAYWNPGANQWQSADIDTGDQSLRYGFARRLVSIPGMRTYKHRSSARRKARQLGYVEFTW